MVPQRHKMLKSRHTLQFPALPRLVSLQLIFTNCFRLLTMMGASYRQAPNLPPKNRLGSVGTRALRDYRKSVNLETESITMDSPINRVYLKYICIIVGCLLFPLFFSVNRSLCLFVFFGVAWSACTCVNMFGRCFLLLGGSNQPSCLYFYSFLPPVRVGAS